MTIRVLIQIDDFKGGPAIFRSRLIEEFKKDDDIKIVHNINDTFDIELVFVRKTKKHKKPYILRIDGCYYQEHRKDWNNNLIESIKGASYFIFQSKNSFKFCTGIIDILKNKTEKKGYEIIYNGVNLNEIDKISPNSTIRPGSFIACARWNDNKRLGYVIESFRRANIEKNLYILGESGFKDCNYERIKNKYRSEKIIFGGNKTFNEIIAMMKSCNYQIHLCHMDSCPNVVIEGLICGLNIICTNLGGTSELIGENGIIIEIDKKWEGKYLNQEILDDFNIKKIEKLSRGIREIINKPKMKTNIFKSRFDIKKIAEKYKKIIVKIMNK